MTVLRTFYPTSRLRDMFGVPNGMRASDAVERASLALEDIRDQCIAAIDEKVERAGALAERCAPEDRETLFLISSEIFSEAGTFGLKELSAVAGSLCKLLGANALAPKAAVVVHTDALRALRRPAIAGNKVLRAAVLQELLALVARFVQPAKG
jgi:hypothetical protein